MLKDKFLDENAFSTLNILRGEVTSVVSGFRTKIANLLSYAESAPGFFGYTKQEFEKIYSLNDLMPFCIAFHHDVFIFRLISTGQPKIIRKYRTAIGKDKNGFIFPVNIYVNYFFNVDDFSFSGLLLKLKLPCKWILLDWEGNIEEFCINFFNFIHQFFPKLP